jgi:hypothetical protein
MKRRLIVAILLAASSASIPSPAEAHITRIVIEPARSESPTFEGRRFGPDGKVGPYEKLRGKAFGEVDPDDPRNAPITDLKLAPRNARGKVEYSMDIFILKPIDLTRGNHKLFLDFNNRGGMRVAALNDAPLSNDPTKAAQAGTGFIMNLGYTIVGNGWDFGASTADDGMTIQVPIARNPDGSSITGPSYEYINFDDARSVRYELTYPAATRDKSKATLTVRARLDDPAARIPDGGWEYVDDTTIRLLPAGTPFKQSHVYEFVYTAKDPVVAALGLAATRDLMSFLRHAAKDEAGNANPLAGDVRYTYSFSISQPSRTLNDFLAFGFNQDEQGRRVIDGMLKWTGGGSGDQINYRFAQTGRTERNRQNHLYPEGVFPFAYPVLTDHLSGRTAGRIAACRTSDTCPKIWRGASPPYRELGTDARWEHSLVVVNAEGRIIEEWTQWDKLFKRPHAVYVSPYDAEKHVWVVDDHSHAIYKFTNDGKQLVQTIGTPNVSGADGTHFNRPTFMAWLPDGSFYVADGYNGTRVARFDAAGKFQFDFGQRGESGKETRPGYMNNVHGVAVDLETRRVFVNDRDNHRIQIFDENGKYLSEWRIAVSPSSLHFVQIGADRAVVTFDRNTHKMLKYDLDGRLLYAWGTVADFPGTLWGVHGMSTDQEGNLYVAEVDAGRFQKFRPRKGANPAYLIGKPVYGAWK